jgi:hypothetical protein
MSRHHAARALTRRVLLRDLERCALGVAAVGLATACNGGDAPGGGEGPWRRDANSDRR